jgi:hypothetical protein
MFNAPKVPEHINTPTTGRPEAQARGTSAADTLQSLTKAQVADLLSCNAWTVERRE